MNLFEVSKKKKDYKIRQPTLCPKLHAHRVKVGRRMLCKYKYYHLMQMFLPFQWPRAHHVTCK